MKSSKFQVSSSKAEESAHFPVNYQWTGSGGMICHGHSVATGKTRKQAMRRFARMFRHIEVVDGGEA